jgi:hypothetical protein
LIVVKAATEAPKAVSIFRDGPSFSIGSAQHPYGCKPCTHYCFSKQGCRNGAACGLCHGVHESNVRKKRERWKKNKGPACRKAAVQQALKEADEEPEPAPAPTMAYARPAGDSAPLLNGPVMDVAAAQALGQLPWPSQPMSLPLGCGASQAPWLGDLSAAFGALPTGAGKAFPTLPPALRPSLPIDAKPQHGRFSYTTENVVAAVGQRVDLVPSISNSVFAIAPDLPAGLRIDMCTGLIHGTALSGTGGVGTYFVTACDPVAFSNIRVATISINIINIQAPPGHNILNVVQHGHGVTTVTFHERG